MAAAVVVLLGGLGGVFYWLTIFPIDVIKSTMQTDNIDPAKRKFPNMAVTAKVILHTAAGLASSPLGCFAPRNIRQTFRGLAQVVIDIYESRRRLL